MIVLVFILLLFSVQPGLLQYEPNWESLDARPLPQWYDDAKIGIFLHWGVFSVPSFGNEWFWYRWKEDPTKPEFKRYMEKNYKPNFTYQEFAKEFTAELFNATEWAELFKNAGAKYVVLTSKHHEGFTLWPSKYSYSWNAMDVGPNRDLVGELGKAVRAANLTYGLYHSLFEWFHPLYLTDKASKWQTRDFPEYKTMPELRELVEKYKPSLIWSDGIGEAPDTYWNSTGFLAWLYNESPVKNTVVVNDRWGTRTKCKHGGYYNCNDHYNPGVLKTHKWENAMTLDTHSWAFRRAAKATEIMSMPQLLSQVASTVSCGGNILINVGPTKDGIIAPIFQERLSDLGKWLSINGEAIYASKPWTSQKDSHISHVWYTSNNGAVYAIVLFWPQTNSISLAAPVKLLKESEVTVTLLGNEDTGPLQWSLNNDTALIRFPDKAIVKSNWAYVLKFQPNHLHSKKNNVNYF